MIRVKICGVNSQVAFDAAADAGADWIGFVFCERSPRAIRPAQAAALSARREGGPGRVGLFVDPTDVDIAGALAALKLAALQIYASAERAAAIRARFGLPVWRSVAVDPLGDLPEAAHGADMLVMEPRPPPGASRPGGNAVALDWNRLRSWQAPCDWLLAGGLRPGNVAQAIAASAASAVDVSSGVEQAPGVKDPDLIRTFIMAARKQGSGGGLSPQSRLPPTAPEPGHSPPALPPRQ